MKRFIRFLSKASAPAGLLVAIGAVAACSSDDTNKLGPATSASSSSTAEGGSGQGGHGGSGGQGAGEPSCPAGLKPMVSQPATDLGIELEQKTPPFCPGRGARAAHAVMASWVHNTPTPAELHFVRIDEGTPGQLGSAVLPGNLATQVDAAAGKDGSTHLIFTETASKLLYYLRLKADGSTSEAVALNEQGSDPWLPQVAVSEDGTAHVLWHEYLAEGITFFEVSVSGTTPSMASKTNIEVVRQGGFLFPEMSAGPDGTLYLVWEDIEPGSMYPDSPDIFLSTRAAGGSATDWTSSVNLTKKGIGFLHSSDASIAVDPKGMVHLVWVEQSTDQPLNFELWYKGDAGNGFGSGVNVSKEGLTNNILTPEKTRIVPDCDGTARLGWLSRPPNLESNEAELHVALSPADPWSAIVRGRRDHDVAWVIDPLGAHHFAWVQPAASKEDDTVRYMFISADNE